MTRTEQMKQRRVRERSWLKWALIALAILVATTAISYVWFSGASMPAPKRTKRVSDSSEAGVFPDNIGKVNILVLGVDQRQEDAGRSDTLFLITVDTRTKKTNLLSIPRDTRVKIPGYGFDKINHAYSLGGHQLTQKTVEGILGAPVDYYIEVDFAGFNKIVDAVGGVNINVEKRMYYEDPYDDLIIDLQPGMQHMNGETAIKYVRYRDETGDIGRIERQQHFVRAMMDEVTSPAILVKLPSVISEVNSTIRTDLSVTELIGLGRILQDAKQQGLQTYTAPGTPVDIHGVNYLTPDIIAIRDYMVKVLDIRADAQYIAATKRLADEYQHSLPDETLLSEEEKPAKAAAPVKPGKDKPKQSVAKPEKPVVPKKSNDRKEAPKPKVEQIKLDIVNASGNKAAGSKMADQLKQEDFSVTQIRNAKNVNNSTVVIAHSADETILNRLTDLPFDYALQVSPKEKSRTQVTVVIGRDYMAAP